jgi:hypothetical protein
MDDPDELSATLIDVLKESQYAPKFEQYVGTLPFPELPELDANHLELLVFTLSSGKAISFDF